MEGIENTGPPRHSGHRANWRYRKCCGGSVAAMTCCLKKQRQQLCLIRTRLQLGCCLSDRNRNLASRSRKGNPAPDPRTRHRDNCGYRVRHQMVGADLETSVVGSIKLHGLFLGLLGIQKRGLELGFRHLELPECSRSYILFGACFFFFTFS